VSEGDQAPVAVLGTANYEDWSTRRARHHQHQQGRGNLGAAPWALAATQGTLAARDLRGCGLGSL